MFYTPKSNKLTNIYAEGMKWAAQQQTLPKETAESRFFGDEFSAGLGDGPKILMKAGGEDETEH
jgi:hypothetical protein